MILEAGVRNTKKNRKGVFLVHQCKNPKIGGPEISKTREKMNVGLNIAKENELSL